jgi:phospholipid/cholesterol/gamma-HCH transport system permease protein
MARAPRSLVPALAPARARISLTAPARALVLATAPLDSAGRSVLLWVQILRRLPFAGRDRRLLAAQVIRIGTDSLPLVLVISVFIGAVTAVQAQYQFHGLIPSNYLGTAVSKFVIIESGPVLTALVLAGRVGASIAAEIAAMKEKEELDAMTALDLDPLRYLALPRMLAGVIAVPLLVIISCLCAIMGGWLVARVSFDVTTETYVQGARFLFSGYDVMVSLLKSIVFGGVVTFTGFHAGLRAGSGARGTGVAAMQAVVAACVWILVLDFVIIFLLY